MSHNKMLIDATHPEETRVVVLRNGRVEEFDFESAARKLLRGNIYLAKVTRVEPSLQAAFIDYGGNRHGFLAFNEIHPDYYTIPVADRQALLEEEAAADAAEEAEADARAEARASRQAARERNQSVQQDRAPRDGEPPREQLDHGDGHAEPDGQHGTPHDGAHDHDEGHPRDAAIDHAEQHAIDVTHLLPPEPAPESNHPHFLASDTGASDAVLRDSHDHGHDYSHDHQHGPDDAPDRGPVSEIEEVGNAESDIVETVGTQEQVQTTADAGNEDSLEEMPSRPRRRPRSYKIQEVIKRRQIILIQIVKEERGTKGAALTTYLSLAGRYTVLMPNTARGGGISRKITNAPDRKRLKAIAQELEVPDGMGLIIRTAGAARTKQEIKRDFEYLLRLWESVRDMTLQSTAPSLVYEEGDLIKRSIRDLYTKDVEEIYVAGDHAFKDARDFMGMLMPSHARNVIDYKAPEPLFSKFGIERQLNAMFSPHVPLRSGGYLVVNQTEALVAIDINSGKSTREFNIEDTALSTNLEAADEIARQLKLRDLAGLIVIDFIDMEEKRNNRAVERRIKDALRFDRARIQVGHISHFGLLEMSRQRLRTGVLEGSTTKCAHCEGTGIIRSVESAALGVIRAIEDALIADGRSSLIAHCTATVALYILNNKRTFITDMEARYGISIAVQADDKLQGANHTIEKTSTPVQAPRRADRAAVNMDWGFDGETDADRAAVESHDGEGHTNEGYGNVEVIEEDERRDDELAPQGRQRSRDRNDRGGERGGGERGGERQGRGGRDRGGRQRGSRDGGGREGARDDRPRQDRARQDGPRDERAPDRNQDRNQDRAAAPRGDGNDFDHAVTTAAEFADIRTIEANGGEGGDGPRSKRRRRRRGRRGDRPAMANASNLEGNLGGNDPGDEDERPSLAPAGELEEIGGEDSAPVYARGSDDVSGDEPNAAGSNDAGSNDTGGESEGGRRGGRRRGRRGGRRNERDGAPDDTSGHAPENAQENAGEPTRAGAHQAAERLAHAPVAESHGGNRDIDHPEKPDQFEPAPADAPAEPAPRDPVRKPRARDVKPEVVAEAATAAEALSAAPPAPAVAAAMTKPEPGAVIAEALKAEAPKLRRADPVASAPVLERVVVSIDGTPAAAPALVADDKPVRKGWWQRKLTGE
jgi:ribonuclease E